MILKTGDRCDLYSTPKENAAVLRFSGDFPLKVGELQKGSAEGDFPDLF